MSNNKNFIVFDVESIGLHGEGFAVGYIIIKDLSIINERLIACNPEKASGTLINHTWVKNNIPIFEYDCLNPGIVRKLFWDDWEKFRSEFDGYLVADCSWPVETNFLSQCIKDNEFREFFGPYPLLDLSSILITRGIDPLTTFERKENELPIHHPLNDARQSARILIDLLK
jgi:hypothetical protein